MTKNVWDALAEEADAGRVSEAMVRDWLSDLTRWRRGSPTAYEREIHLRSIPEKHRRCGASAIYALVGGRLFAIVEHETFQYDIVAGGESRSMNGKVTLYDPDAEGMPLFSFLRRTAPKLAWGEWVSMSADEFRNPSVVAGKVLRAERNGDGEDAVWFVSHGDDSPILKSSLPISWPALNGNDALFCVLGSQGDMRAVFYGTVYCTAHTITGFVGWKGDDPVIRCRQQENGPELLVINDTVAAAYDHIVEAAVSATGQVVCIADDGDGQYIDVIGGEKSTTYPRLHSLVLNDRGMVRAIACTDDGEQLIEIDRIASASFHEIRGLVATNEYCAFAGRWHTQWVVSDGFVESASADEVFSLKVSGDTLCYGARIGTEIYRRERPLAGLVFPQ
jgi:hypothetical protein